MRIVPLELMNNIEPSKDGVYRHVPENKVEKIAAMQFIADCLCRDAKGRKEIVKEIPYIEMKLPCSKRGCFAFLTISRDELPWDDDGWDDEGRLKGSIIIRHVMDSDYFDDDPFSETNKKDNPFPRRYSHSIYFSMISASTTDTNKNALRLLWEFPINSSNSENKSGEKDTNNLPCLKLPPKHPHYGEVHPESADKTLSDYQFSNKISHHLLHSQRELSYNVDHNIINSPRTDESAPGRFHEDDMRNHFPDEEAYQNWIDSSD